jgi:hypothetical protein
MVPTRDETNRTLAWTAPHREPGRPSCWSKAPRIVAEADILIDSES